MITKIKFLLVFFYIKSIFIFLSIFILQVNAETKIVAKKGDTLFKISKQYGISLKELMHKNNFNNANKIVEGEIILIPLNVKRKDINNENTYKVKEGDTLYRIAKDYNVSVKEILDINNLDTSSLLKPNQIIQLPKVAINKNLVSKNSIKKANKKVFYHQTSKIENLSDIAEIHNIIKEDIIVLNDLNDTIRINSNTKLKIRKNKSIKWLKYGSLTLNWSDWRYFDGNYITQAKNKKNKPFLLAINCETRALNNTLENSSWTNWYFPKSDFEFKLLNDFCDHDYKI